MKSKVKVLVVALGLAVVSVPQAAVMPAQATDYSAPVATTVSAVVVHNEPITQLQQLDNQLAIIHPCYRWPHPCD